MMWHRLLNIAWILFGFEIKNGKTSCLTWCMEGENLKLICRVDNFSDYISITDPQGKQQAHCDLSMTIPRCISNGSIKVNTSTQDIELVLKNIQSNMINGLWTCNQRQNSSSILVSTENGIINASNVHISVDEVNGNPNTTAKIRCSSCRVPRGNHVEFLINNVTVDSIIHNRLYGNCTHINGDCKPEMCSCSSNGREFTWMIELTTDNLTISCEMSFSDKTKISYFTIIANMHYNGKKFIKMPPIRIVTKKPEGTGSKEETDDIIPDNDIESKENATVSGEITEKDFPWKVIAVASVITVSVLVIGIVIHCTCRKYNVKINCENRKRHITTKDQYEDPKDNDKLYEDINLDDHRTYAVNDTKSEAVTEERNTPVMLNKSYEDIGEVPDEKKSTSVKNGSSYENAAETDREECRKIETPVDHLSGDEGQPLLVNGTFHETATETDRQECIKKESPVDHLSGDEGQPLLVNGTFHETGDRQKGDDLRVRKNIHYMVEETGENKEAADNVIYLTDCHVRNIHKEASFRIGSMTTTSSGELLVCDIDSKRVFKFDKDFVYIKTIETDHEPYDIAVIPGGKRAVTTCHRVPFLQVLNIEGSTILKTKLVNKDSADSGIFCTNINIIVGGRKQIYLYSHELSLEKTISITGSEGVIRSLCCVNEIICLIEQGSSTVQFVTLCGEKENSYDPKSFNLPTKAIVGKNNDIFILERVARKIHHLSARGDFIQMIDPVKYDLTSPITICFSRDCTKLYVSNESGSSILEFNVVYQ